MFSLALGNAVGCMDLLVCYCIQLAEQHRQRKLAERDPYTGEDAMNNTLPLYTEGGGGKDNFRGFNPEKRKEILKENERLIAFKKYNSELVSAMRLLITANNRAMKDREREEEEAWHKERLLAARAMEQVRGYIVDLVCYRDYFVTG
jgi:hypothetical protein